MNLSAEQVKKLLDEAQDVPVRTEVVTDWKSVVATLERDGYIVLRTTWQATRPLYAHLKKRDWTISIRALATNVFLIRKVAKK